MGDLSHLIDMIPAEKNNEPPEVQMAAAIEKSGIIPPVQIAADGKIHRFNADKRGGKTGWYILFPGLFPAGAFGDWREGIGEVWRGEPGRDLTPVEIIEYEHTIEKARRMRDTEVQRARADAARECAKIWKNARTVKSHPYLDGKNVKPHGLRQSGDGVLLIPAMQGKNKIASMQYITADGKKRYHTGGQIGGSYFIIGAVASVIYLAEGYATAASIHEATGDAVVVAFHASNLVPVAKKIREEYGQQIPMVIVADNDASGVGLKEAKKAAESCGGRIIEIPILGMDANDYASAGNDLAGLLSPRSQWIVSTSDMCREPAPIKWIVKGWMQEECLAMIHGPSGAGKTFAVLDMALRVASGRTEWMGAKIQKKRPVLYLAGEGHHGLRGRIAAWMQANHVQPDEVDMYVSKSAIDFNKPEGLAKVIEAIESMPRVPEVIVIDTLHRFFDGNENSAEDVKSMLDSCGHIIVTYNATIILIHHTGLSPDAQKRPRGSSAWKGGLDIEISVTQQEGKTVKIVQTKMKEYDEGPPVFARIDPQTIDGWYDEDGEPVSSAVLISLGNLDEAKESADAVIRESVLESAWNIGGNRKHVEPVTKEVESLFTPSDLATVFESQGLTESSARQRAYRELKEWESAGVVTKRGRGLYSFSSQGGKKWK